MNKIWLIIQREFLNRVQKKSFLVATILVPLIFPALMAVLVYVAVEQKKNATKEVILYIDESGYFKPDTAKFLFSPFQGSVEDGKRAFEASENFGLLYIPKFELNTPGGIKLYTKVNPSPSDVSDIEKIFENHIRDLKMEQLNIDQEMLNRLKTNVEIDVKISEGGVEKSSDSKVSAGIGMASGILMYMFIFIYGAQIMQGIIEEKMSKVVEVIVSSVRPFQLMMGKILGLASVGLLQFLIWIVLISTLSTVVLGFFGLQSSPQEMMQMNEQAQQVAAAQGPDSLEFVKVLNQIPWAYLLGCFVFYFIGGYLLYGALFAAVGSAVDSPAEAQQFMFPITIPMLISYFALFTFILEDPHGTISIWLSIIPLTSPIAMMGRIGFGVPFWQLALSMVLLAFGFVATTWFAARIYRVGILMHGTKVSYMVLAKWFLQKG